MSRRLAYCGELRKQLGDTRQRLAAVVDGHALIAHHRARPGTPELSALLHRDEHMTRAQRHLVDLFRDVSTEAPSRPGQLPDDVAPDASWPDPHEPSCRDAARTRQRH